MGAATKGVLTFMVGGDKESCDQATPLLECMGRTVVHCGDSGTGQVAKICNNMLLAIEMIGTSEALQLGIKWVYSYRIIKVDVYMFTVNT